MSDSGLFYCGVLEHQLTPDTKEFIKQLKAYSDEHTISVYVIDKALGQSMKIEAYDYVEKFIVLIPKHKIMLIDYGAQINSAFDNFVEDFISDLEYLSKRYDYQRKLGRSRNWKDCIAKLQFNKIAPLNIKDVLQDNSVSVPRERTVELLISLLIGSINDIQKIGLDDPRTLLEKVKQKIVLFDGMQSRFLYKNLDQDIIRIQGLAGTGKTELLLHKLSEVYVAQKNTRIVFTCYNKVLAADMQVRIPQFFNFMKIEEQIEWNTRLFVFASWGAQFDHLSGLYSYLCHEYNLKFYRFSDKNNFDDICKEAVEELKNKSDFQECFDYIFIDESQDFPPHFFELCKRVTKQKLYIAGDVFQNIFDTTIKSSEEIDYTLNKCYRTDPRTLMVAHSIGMGLFEIPVIRWLEDEEWRICGYILNREKGKVLLKRLPLRRFEDIDSSSMSSIQICRTSQEKLSEQVLECIDDIRQKNPTVQPDDISIVFLENTPINYDISDRLVFDIASKYNWTSTKGYVVKSKEKNQVFISNKNNIKGLEFPFIICIETEKITEDLRKRNSIYMILTRSFLCSYFVINDDKNESFINIYEKAIQDVNDKGYLELREPTQKEKDLQAEKIKIAVQKPHKSVEDVLNEVLNEYPNLTSDVRSAINTLISTRLPRKWNEADVKRIVKMIIEDLAQLTRN